MMKHKKEFVTSTFLLFFHFYAYNSSQTIDNYIHHTYQLFGEYSQVIKAVANM